MANTFNPEHDPLFEFDIEDGHIAIFASGRIENWRGGYISTVINRIPQMLEQKDKEIYLLRKVLKDMEEVSGIHNYFVVDGPAKPV